MYLRFIPNRNYSTCDRKNINMFLVIYGKDTASLCMLFIYDPNDIARCPNHRWLQHLFFLGRQSATIYRPVTRCR